VGEWLRVFTYKTGLLSPVAHDLQLSLDRWDLTREGTDIIFEARSQSLEIDGPIVRGKLEPRGISDKDRKKIKRNILDTVLLSRTHPMVIFRGSQQGAELRGELRLRGQTLPLVIPITHSGDQLQGQVEIQPTRWGIAPFKALAGAIKLQDRVRIEFSIRML
jgi:hypothetical protein